ncbi:unnamed protein product [Phytophthora lilii]|uniref:Unnamed protein product n=1 Tax=Phytophthora lilii TaxID=2077276 RepID=A0A9W6XXQ7_9STRA|nr:unnamed protein product [Phytophthora lilii]
MDSRREHSICKTPVIHCRQTSGITNSRPGTTPTTPTHSYSTYVTSTNMKSDASTEPPGSWSTPSETPSMLWMRSSRSTRRNTTDRNPKRL